jgi:hypothetical protein
MTRQRNSYEMENFFDNRLFADCVLVSPRSKPLFAHKVVLSAHSRVFKEIFSRQQNESATDLLVIGSEHREEDLRAVVKGIYEPCSITEWPTDVVVLQRRLVLALKYELDLATQIRLLISADLDK